MTNDSPRWVARLVVAPGTDVAWLLAMPLGLDVWERDESSLVVAASENQLAEVERRRLARVLRMGTVEEFAEQHSPTTRPAGNQEER
jgi:hypothetical protein